jgi:hypothetical protein
VLRVRVRVAAPPGAGLARAGLILCLLAIAGLLAPAVAAANGVAPTVVTGVNPDNTSFPPQPVTASQELVGGYVNPHGQTTRYAVQYAPAGDTWCTSGGSQGTPTTTPIPGITLNYTDSVGHSVSVAVSGLTGGTAYCAQLVASNGTGTTQGGQIDFTAGLPLVTTSSATGIGPQQATVQGTVDPASQATSYSVVYDLASSAWCTSGTGSPSYETAPVALSAQDALTHQVTASITQTGSTPLIPNTDYCAAIAASNGSSDAAGSQVIGTVTVSSFSTLAAATSDSVESISATTAQVSGQIDPDGVSTAYYVAYGPVASNWCQLGTGAPPAQTTPVTLPAQDLAEHQVTVDISGLTTGTTYCVELRSQNAPLGVSDGGQIPRPLEPPFTVGLPTATTADVTPDAPTTAVVDGTVGPSGQSTLYDVVYDLQNSNWCLSGGTQGSPSDVSAYVPLAETDSATYSVSARMTGLTPGTQYCVALAALNGSNGQSGSPSPTIGGPPIDFTAGLAPVSEAASAADVTGSRSVVSATVNAEGQSTNVHVAYGTATSDWCTGGPSSPDHTTADVPVSPADTNDHTVNITLTGLTGGTAYCAAVVTTNASGSSTGPQTQFVAGLPSADAAAPDPASPTAAVLAGTITPTTQATSYYAAYDTSSSLWCQGGGGDPTAASLRTSPVALGPIDDVAHDVTVTITGLAPGESYCAELVAVNASGEDPSPLRSFLAGFPFTTSTTATENVTDTSATVDGSVNPAGLATSDWVGYDLADSDWCASGGQDGLPALTTPAVALPAADTLDHPVSAVVTGLDPATTYCAAVIAANDMGTSTGPTLTFTTQDDAGDVPVDPGFNPPSGGVPPSAPGIATTSAITPHTATVHAAVNPGGESTSVHAAYAPASSPFCVAGGAGGDPRVTAATDLGASDATPHSVAVTLRDLDAGTRYCVQLVADNAAGEAHSVVAIFTTVGVPRLDGLRLSSARFTAASRRGASGGGHRAGTRVSFHVTQAGRVSFTVARESRGGHGTIVGRFTRSVRAGENGFEFDGVVGGRALRPGHYVLTAVATDRWRLSGARRTLRFTIA